MKHKEVFICIGRVSENKIQVKLAQNVSSQEWKFYKLKCIEWVEQPLGDLVRYRDHHF